MMDKYIRVARVYPAVLGLIPTCILLAMCMREWLPQYQAFTGNIKWVLCLLGGTMLVYMAVGYLISEIFKETSKWLFQYPLFKLDETEMPTTKILLWRNDLISPEYHNEIAAKVKAKFEIKLPTREDESASYSMAKLTIADAVSQIRQYCRGDKILRQYNIEFGFCRNYLGASVWDLMFIIGIGVANIFCGWLPWLALVMAFVFQMVMMFGCYQLLKTRGWIYARCLFATFTSIN